ncbi:5-formyltetrahydrofolate cycloligase [Raphidocelis subcapitata]|uniref:5-formyltetrahydrofolate cyclo-ligase n=1 Tax=Raphidocelis subcapitata TaxID=307507 RepID=A0A2V0NJL8_9CHLO|nr:5-formyltetrahydrofolate cycloligase [Raphidocelis subcapitata]|eukprot:GBF87421.1 5-formyltetrahydrofolate cycloligase [Raphidocelis subcapitata]
MALASEAGGGAAAAKKAARREIIKALKALGDDAMAAQNAAIAARVLASRAFASARTVGVYIHCAKLHEVDTMPLLRDALAQGKRVYVPLVDDRNSNMRLLHIDAADDMRPAPPFGILEPSVSYADGSARENVMEMERPLDLLLMPGLGFDAAGGRLGRGGGYYDKFVRGLQQRAAEQGWAPPLLVALAFTEQLRDGGVPMEPHDAFLDAVVTPGALHLCSDAARRAEAGGG